MYNHNQAHLTFSLGKNVKHYSSQLCVYTSFPRCYNSDLYLDPHTGDFHLIPMFSLQIQMWFYVFMTGMSPFVLLLFWTWLELLSWSIPDKFQMYI